MDMMIEEIPELRIAYFRNIGPYGGEANKELMEKVKSWARKNDLLESSVILGIPQDHPDLTPPEACRYDTAVVIAAEIEVKGGAMEGIFTGGKYAVFTLYHTEEAITEWWKHMPSDIEKSGLSIRNRPIVERYTDELIKQHRCEMLVPIE
ncbi:GyrI-like domain-containing protein [Rossellomorea marisflavi]|uniref:AraC family transcriptional regulator n=1 Tax=Rossellomorea marisflavi TaxID=189381 RepID=UPI0009A80F10|nr:GyrI-like domain-containing protein [Rossellomorea marisflavi]MDW4525621.1 GyrI-like domain-containing protein [Rossellomorea marisflavi]